MVPTLPTSLGQVPGRACTQQLKWEKKTGHFKTSYQVIFKVSDRVSDLVWWVESNLQPVSKNVSKIVMLYPYNKTVSLLLNTVFETLKLQGLQITYYEKITTNSTVWSWAGSINWVFRAVLLKRLPTVSGNYAVRAVRVDPNTCVADSWTMSSRTLSSEGSCQFTLSEPLLQVNPHSVTAPTDFGLQCE